ncbi:hypothetical protein [Bacillus cereus]
MSKYAMHHPILIAGLGAHKIIISEERLEELYKELQEFITLLYNVDSYKKYNEIMQSIRLVQLAFLNMREDYALSYYLLISSIELFASMAIKKNKVVSKHPLNEKWGKLAEENEDIFHLFKEYTRLNGEDKQLRKRFVEFILEYFPPNQWNQLEHPSEGDLAAIALYLMVADNEPGLEIVFQRINVIYMFNYIMVDICKESTDLRCSFLVLL